MNKIRFRIAVLVGGSVLLTLLIIMAAFNLIVRSRIRRNADTALHHIFSVDEEKPVLLYAPETVIVFDGDSGGENGQVYSQKELDIMAWCEQHQPADTTEAVIGGNAYCLLRLTPADIPEDGVMEWGGYRRMKDEEDVYSIELSALSLGSGGLSSVIGYVDITGELDMIRQINLVFLAAALLIGLFGSTFGYFIGRRLEQNQLIQKRFFENTSHELKTPLTSIRGYAEGIQKGVITDYQKTGSVIAAQTEKMSSLIEEILCLAKVEGGAVKPERETVDVPAFLQDCLMPFEGTVLSRGLTVRLALEPMTVQADPDRLGHAVTNLLTNALKYARSEIAVSCGNGTVTIRNDCEELTDDTLRHLFERFYTGRGGNTGIGLSLAKELIELHGWKITAERTENGIRFVIRCS